MKTFISVDTERKIENLSEEEKFDVLSIFKLIQKMLYQPDAGIAVKIGAGAGGTLYAVHLDGWQIVLADRNGTIVILGIMKTDEPGSDLMHLLNRTENSAQGSSSNNDN